MYMYNVHVHAGESYMYMYMYICTSGTSMVYQNVCAAHMDTTQCHMYTVMYVHVHDSVFHVHCTCTFTDGALLTMEFHPLPSISWPESHTL